MWGCDFHIFWLFCNSDPEEKGILKWQAILLIECNSDPHVVNHSNGNSGSLHKMLHTTGHPGCWKASLPTRNIPSARTDAWGCCTVGMPAAYVLLSWRQPERVKFWSTNSKLGKQVAVQKIVICVRPEDLSPALILTLDGWGQICCCVDAVAITCWVAMPSW